MAGGARPASACSSTGASTPCPPASGRASASKEIGEWIMSWANIPRAEYETFAPQFNPVKFDAAEWVRIAKDAGMKYIVITSKHHDGFALFDSEVSRLRHRGRARRTRRTCEARSRPRRSSQGLKFCFYYSIMDWHHPAQYGGQRQASIRHAGDRKNQMRPGTEGRVRHVHEGAAQGAAHEVRPGGPLVRRRVGGLVDRAGRPGAVRLRARTQAAIIVNNRVGKGRKGMEGLNKDDQRLRRRLRHARAGDPRHRPARRRLGNLHDDERHLGLQVLRPELEVDRDARAQL